MAFKTAALKSLLLFLTVPGTIAIYRMKKQTQSPFTAAIHSLVQFERN
jgi:hypothetical protein